MKLVEEGIFDKFDREERCDSKIKPEDLKRLEIELRKKQKRRIRREKHESEGRFRIPQRGELEDEDIQVDDDGNVVRGADGQYMDRLLDDNENVAYQRSKDLINADRLTLFLDRPREV